MKTKIRKGTRRYFVGNTQIKSPKNHGCLSAVFTALVEQAGFSIKEWNGMNWIDTNQKIMNKRNNH